MAESSDADCPADGGEGPAPLVRTATNVHGILCADEAFGRRAAEVLVKSAIPAVATTRQDGRAVVVVPEIHGNHAVNVLLTVKGIVLDTSSEPYFRLYDASKDDVIFEHPVLLRSVESIRAGGSAAHAQTLEDLESCYTRGNAPVVSKALLLLARLGVDAWPTLDKLLLAAIRLGDASRVGAILRAGRGAEGRKETGLPESLRELETLARHPEAPVRQQSIRVLAAIRAFEAAPILAEALLDAEPGVAIEADDGFLEWGADDLDFDPELDMSEKQRIAEQRRAFRQPKR